MPKGFFKVENIGDDKARININGIVGDWYDGNTSLDVLNIIENTEAKEIEVTIQSPGGSAFEGIAIYNALKQHSAKVTTIVLGAAASAASIIFMAGDERIMPENTWLMIHEPNLRISGKAKELREAADFLDSLTQTLLSTYSPYINIDDDELMELIVAETWINANDAATMGFATQVNQELQAVALSQDFTARFDNLPQAMGNGSVAQIIAGINNIKDFEKVLRESGCSKSLATALVGKAKSLLQSESAADLESIYTHLSNFKLD